MKKLTHTGYRKGRYSDQETAPFSYKSSLLSFSPRPMTNLATLPRLTLLLSGCPSQFLTFTNMSKPAQG